MWNGHQCPLHAFPFFARLGNQVEMEFWALLKLALKLLAFGLRPAEGRLVKNMLFACG
jgi:hypothetical protein